MQWVNANPKKENKMLKKSDLSMVLSKLCIFIYSVIIYYGIRYN